MDLAATWKLASLQAQFRRLEGYQKTITDLSDIRELRTFRDDVLEALRDAAARSLTPPDPAAVVATDWERLCRWSNHLQNAILQAGNTAADLDAPADHLEISQLTRWVSELEAAPNHLSAALAKTRDAIRTAEWQGDQPHPTFALAARELDLKTNLVLANPAGKWAQGVLKLLHPLCSSYRIAKVDDSPVRARIDMLAQRLSKARRLVREHARQAAELAELARLIQAGSSFAELGSRLMLIAASTRFADLHYAYEDIDAFIRREAQRNIRLQEATVALEKVISDAETCCCDIAELKLKLRTISILSVHGSDDLIILCTACDKQARAALSLIHTESPFLLKQLGSLFPATFYPNPSASQIAEEKEIFQSWVDTINEQATALSTVINKHAAALTTAIDELAQLKRQLKRKRTKRISIIIAAALLIFGLVGFVVRLFW